MIAEALSRLRVSDVSVALEDRAVIELVFGAAREAIDIAARAEALMPGLAVTARTAFEGESDRYIFLDFANVSPRGNEQALFALARAVRPELEAAEAHPVLPRFDHRRCCRGRRQPRKLRGAVRDAAPG